MPPKKRKAVEAAPESQPQKRVTRSSTTKDVVTKPQSTESTTKEAKASKPTSTATKAKTQKKPESTSDAAKQSKKGKPDVPVSETPKAKKTKAHSKPSAQPPNNTSPTTFKSLSISSHLIKNPVQCHSYSAPTTSPTLVFTHGAGGDCSASAVVNFCTGFSATYPILAFQGSMNLASRVKGFHACVEHLGDDEKRLVLGGRSMGARAAVMAASEILEKEEKKEVVLILASYPLQGPKDVRDRILLDLPANVRVLFVIGDRDAMCPLDLLGVVRKKIKAKNQLVVVRSADHGMHVKPRKMEREIGEQTGRVAADWVAGKVEDDVTYVGDEG